MRWYLLFKALLIPDPNPWTDSIGLCDLTWEFVRNVESEIYPRTELEADL